MPNEVGKPSHVLESDSSGKPVRETSSRRAIQAALEEPIPVSDEGTGRISQSGR